MSWKYLSQNVSKIIENFVQFNQNIKKMVEYIAKNWLNVTKIIKNLIICSKIITKYMCTKNLKIRQNIVKLC